MSYDLYDANGFIGGGPSTSGLRDLKDALRGISSATYPQMAMLLQHGHCTSPIRLKYEAMALGKHVYSETVKSTLLGIGLAAAKASETVILHDHVS